MNRKIKISIISFSVLLGISFVFSFGFLCGILYIVDPSCGSEHKLSDRKERIQTQTELYKPSCEELKNKGLPKLIRHDNDYFFVDVKKDYFHVFGINVDPSEPPVMFWWGAGLEYSLEQNCPE